METVSWNAANILDGLVIQNESQSETEEEIAGELEFLSF